MSESLAETAVKAAIDLADHRGEFDAIVCAGDHHGIAIGSVIAAYYEMPLMIVCMSPHDEVVSHITMIGDIKPTDRFLYVDDMFAFGASLRYVMEYLNQSAPANVVATYEAMTREYRERPRRTLIPHELWAGTW